MREHTRVRGRSRILTAERGLPVPHVEEPDLDFESGSSFLDRADDEAVGVQLAPAIERDVGQRCRRRNRRVDIARNQTELALEIQVVEEHLADRFRNRHRFRVLGERNEFGNGKSRRSTTFTRNRRGELRGLLRLLWRRLLLLRRRLLGERGRRASGKKRDEDYPFHLVY